MHEQWGFRYIACSATEKLRFASHNCRKVLTGVRGGATEKERRELKLFARSLSRMADRDRRLLLSVAGELARRADLDLPSS